MRRRMLVVSTLAVLILGSALSPSIAAAGGCGYYVCSGTGTGDTLGAGASNSAPGSDAQVSNGNSGSSGPYSFTRRTYSLACSGNGPTVTDNICGNAVNCPDPLDNRYWVYEATVTGPPEVQGPWRSLTTACLDLATVAPTMADIRAQVEAEFVKKRPTTPVVTVSPPDGIVVHLPNGFSAGSAAPIQLPADTVLGLPVVITAQPVRWHWDFGDGTTVTTTTPGTPRTLQVSHTYTSTGPHPVTVTVEHTGTFTLGGFTGSFPITGTARVTSAPTTITAHEAHAQLVDD
jgi:hypothetical protein